MRLPNLQLMRAYGNEGVFFQKTANMYAQHDRESLLIEAQIELNRLEELRTKAMHLEAQRLNAKARLMELAKMEATINNARHTRAPILVPSNSDFPVGMTEGMVRMASVIGADMAKMASNPYREPAEVTSPVVESAGGTAGPLPDAPKAPGKLQKFIDTKGGFAGKTLGMRNAVVKPLALAGTAATLYAGHKALKHGLGWLGKEAPTQTYNAGGNQLAPDVNEYGQAQLRLPSHYY